MSTSNTLAILFFLVFAFSACEKEEFAVDPHEKGNVNTTTVELDPDYKYQVYYEFKSNSEVARVLKTAWDLGFECDAQGHHIKLNSSKAMQVFHTGQQDMDQVTTSPSFGWTWDRPSGHLDSTAIGTWYQQENDQVSSLGEVFIIDRGYDPLGNRLGFKKMKITGYDQAYQITYANLDGSNMNTHSVVKNSEYNFTFFSFDEQGSTVDIEPKKTNWDLQFTQYTHIFYDEADNPTFYLVTGVLHNPYQTVAKRDTSIGFENFSYDDALESDYVPDQNTIGYDWKRYNYDAGGYNLKPEINYVLKLQSGLYFKMHFIDFYNEQGAKGAPTFEFQQL